MPGRNQLSSFVAIVGLCLSVNLPTDAADRDDPHAGHDAPSAHEQTEQEQAGHGHSGHEMEPWMYDELRKRVDVYRSLSDAEIDASMKYMPPDYTSYLSAGGLQGPVGVLVLAHGFGDVGDEAFRRGLGPVAEEAPTSVAFGMSMTRSAHVQKAVDSLTAAGAKTIVVVPALSSAASAGQLGQWQYMFGAADEPGYARTPRIETDAGVIWTPALEDHPLVVEAIADYAREKSRNPADEVVIIVSHGPNDTAANARNVALLNRIGATLKARDGYADVKAMSMQNDAFPEIRKANGLRLREMVETANRNGQRVIIVTNLQSPASIQRQVEQDIAGTEYVFNAKGLVQHPNYAKWVRAVVDEAAGDGA